MWIDFPMKREEASPSDMIRKNKSNQEYRNRSSIPAEIEAKREDRLEDRVRAD